MVIEFSQMPLFPNMGGQQGIEHAHYMEHDFSMQIHSFSGELQRLKNRALYNPLSAMRHMRGDDSTNICITSRLLGFFY